MRHAIVLAMGALWVPAAAAALAAGALPEAATPLGLAVLVESETGQVHVGQPVAVRVILENSGAAPLAVLDWERFPEVLRLQVRVTDYPSSAAHGWPTASGWGMGHELRARDFRTLPPGKTALAWTVTLMLPGRARVSAVLDAPYDTFRESPDAEPKRPENVWKGRLEGSAQVLVAGEMPPPMKEKYEALRRRLVDPGAPEDERKRILSEVVADRHYFAAQFLRDAYQGLSPGPVKDAALERLVELAKFGTAYESLAILVGAMGSDRTPQAVRLDLLAWLGDLLARNGVQPLAGQAVHKYSEPLLQQARDAIRRLVADGDPAVGARARQIVESWEKED